MRKFFEQMKNSVFGIIVVIWGILMFLFPEINQDASMHLMELTFSKEVVAGLFTVSGAAYIFSKFVNGRRLSAYMNILIAFIFMTVMLTHLYASFFMIAWIAFGGIVIHQTINAFLIRTGNDFED